MGKCSCGFTRDEEKNCDGTHKVVRAVREKIATDIEQAHESFNCSKVAVSVCSCQLSVDIARGKK